MANSVPTTGRSWFAKSREERTGAYGAVIMQLVGCVSDILLGHVGHFLRKAGASPGTASMHSVPEHLPDNISKLR